MVRHLVLLASVGCFSSVGCSGETSPLPSGEERDAGKSGADAGHSAADAGGIDGGIDSEADAGASEDAGTPAETLSRELAFEDAHPWQPLRTINPWGVAPSSSSSQQPAVWAKLVAAAGVGSVRGIGGVPQVDVLVDAGLAPAGILIWSPPGPFQFPVGDLAGWAAHIQEVMSAEGPRIDHWEIWNEPPNFTADTSPESYGAIVAAAWPVVKAANPSAQVGLAAQSVNLQFLDQALQHGAAGHFDYVTVHPYEVVALLDRGFEAQLLSIVPTIRKLLAARSPAQANAKVWFTEFGTPLLDGVTPERQATALIKTFVLGLAQGVEVMNWFEPLDGDSGPFGLIAPDGTLRPSYIALRTLIAELGARPVFLGWVLLEDRHHAFLFRAERGVTLVAWAPPGVTAPLALLESVRRVDPRTQSAQETSSLTLTNEPVVLHSDGADGLAWLQRARAHRGKPYPWAGDHSTEGSIRFQAPDDEQGVHPLAAPVTRVLDGETVWDASPRSGQSFAVDPNFSSYTSSPLRITVELRRNGPASAGFNIKYESALGWRSADSQWNYVPADDEWHRLSWLVTDPQFVGKWGFHFALDSDSTLYSGYSLRSVTVAKE